MSFSEISHQHQSSSQGLQIDHQLNIKENNMWKSTYVSYLLFNSH